jgi:hypothetical protein
MAMLMVTALAVTACGGGDGSGSASQGAAPTVSDFSSQNVNQDTLVSANFTVSDDGGTDALMVSASTSDPSIVSIDGITITGSGANRTVKVMPAEDATGRVNIQISAMDAQGNVGVSILPLRFNAVNQSIRAFTTARFAKDENDTPVQVSGFTFVQDADDDNTFASLVQ